jgi:hypothetical protein
MVLVWHDAKSFRQHVAQMRAFRQLHNPLLEDSPAPPKNIAKTLESLPSSKTGDVNSAREKLTIVPIWKITLPRGSQN